ncbi:MAG: hypothetical protein U0269_30645 [Polyangiales bacterium]
MSVVAIGHILASAAEAGFEVGVIDGRVRVRRVRIERPHEAPARADEAWRAPLRAIDPCVVERVLALDVRAAIASLDDAAREDFEERAAILEHEAGVPRAMAERVAWCWAKGGAR